MNFFYKFCLFLLFISSLNSSLASYSSQDTLPFPIRVADQIEIPHFSDDLNFENMTLAIDRQIQSLMTASIDYAGNDLYVADLLIRSLDYFRLLVVKAKDCLESKGQKNCLNDFNRTIKKEFKVYVPDHGLLKTISEDVKFTAYYSPLMKGSLTPSEEYPYAFYSTPQEESLRTLTRVEIDLDKKLSSKGYELFYVNNLYDLYLFHIEGGGGISIADEAGQERIHYLSYDISNELRFRFISRYMMNVGMIDDPSVRSQRRYLERNPRKWREVYSQCPSYIFFKETQTPPHGVNDIPLTDNRSLAQDLDHYRIKGLISFVRAKRPVPQGNMSNGIGQIEFSRFFIDQDTGGAIRGVARADLYFGFGEYAEFAAHNFDSMGEIYYLILK